MNEILKYDSVHRADILVIYTGGTIGMVATEKGLAPSTGFDARLRSYFGEQQTLARPSFDVLELSPLIDSANIRLSHWQKIAMLLRENWQDYRGFVILHGTDTLAYTASALSFILGACDKNVLLTGSQIPLGVAHSDAPKNVELALTLAVGRSIPDVSIVFNDVVLRGCRAQKVSSHAFAAFASPNEAILGEAAIHIKLYFDRMFRQPRPTALQAPVDMAFVEASVAVVTLTPSLPAGCYKGLLQPSNCRAIILQTFGAGNIADENVELVEFIKQAQQQRINIVNLTQCRHGGVSQGAYAAGSVLKEANVLSGYDMTLEAAFCKLHYLIALGMGYDEIQDNWSVVLAGEYSSQ